MIPSRACECIVPDRTICVPSKYVMLWGNSSLVLISFFLVKGTSSLSRLCGSHCRSRIRKLREDSGGCAGLLLAAANASHHGGQGYLLGVGGEETDVVTGRPRGGHDGVVGGLVGGGEALNRSQIHPGARPARRRVRLRVQSRGIGRPLISDEYATGKPPLDGQ